MYILLKNAQIVTEQTILDRYDLLIHNQKIEKIERNIELENLKAADVQVIDCKGAYLMPGIIDIHSDMIESFIQPRSTAVMDFELGFLEAERTLGICGITTMFHSISMYREGTWDSKMIRQAPQVRKIAKMIREYGQKESIIHHKYHLRYEVDNIDCYEQVKEMVQKNEVDLISFMDHAPGQGQYKDLSIYRKHLPNAGKDLSEQEFQEIVEQEMKKERITGKKLEELATCAHDKNITIASHDDDTLQRLEQNEALGVKISEFPITLEVAKEAVRKNMLTVLGAPNVLLGGSHSGNLSAVQAIEEGAASILVSDYYPQALLQAVFKLYKEEKLPLHQAVNMVTSNPAKATGLYEDRGSIEEQKRADILVVSEKNGFPFVERVFVNGTCVLSCSMKGME